MKTTNPVLAGMFLTVHASGRAIMTHAAFNTMWDVLSDDAREVVADALCEGTLRKGVTGYWLREAADPGALAVFARAMLETTTEA